MHLQEMKGKITENLEELIELKFLLSLYSNCFIYVEFDEIYPASPHEK